MDSLFWSLLQGQSGRPGASSSTLLAYFCPLGCLSAQNSLLCLIPELLLSIYNPVTLTDLFLIEYLP